MKNNIIALLIGSIGAAFTLFAYSQTFISPNQSITIGLIVLILGLLVGGSPITVSNCCPMSEGKCEKGE
ncbi:hypothetical protein Lalb_Chr06g0175261 [Lupinus albus]|uniref:Uncharacterized protein n=1 Tax=Lupinus albus TaxID=3870 RepID=A0A6A4QEB8_LUPAL|nr:hypothetical protein Lalb_Chr06g0175261 [Lupinus albus]